jgi:hypothetical protein
MARPATVGREGTELVTAPGTGDWLSERVRVRDPGRPDHQITPGGEIAHGQPLVKIADKHAVVDHRDRLGVAGQRDLGEPPAGGQFDLTEDEGP